MHSERRSAKSLPDGFLHSAKQWPDAPAVTDGQRSLTYAELADRSTELADRLARAGVEPGTLVGLRVPRGLNQVVSILATLMRGAAYVPIDPAYPQPRQQHIVHDAGLKTLVEQETTGETLTVTRSPEAPRVNVPDGTAYVIYTSGSTGKPKGVVIGHRQVSAMLDGVAPVVAAGPGDAWTLFHSFSFDFSVWEMWGALLTGGRLVIVTTEDTRDPLRFAKLLEAEAVAVLNQVPTAFSYLVSALEETGTRLPHLRHVLLSGEAVNLDVVARWHRTTAAPEATVHNLYGITETTVFVTEHQLTTDRDVPASAPTPIGHPLPHLQVRLVDDQLQEVPVGEPGEALVTGASVAYGYLGRPELTAQRFVSLDDGAVGYRSGDWAVRDETGALFYIGRRDRQVQLRGYRIELGEIEAAVRGHTGVDECAVVEIRNALDEPMLAAHYVAHAGGGPTPEELRVFVAERLPHHLVPAVFRQRSAMPVSSTGKIDWDALKSEP